MGRDHSSHRIEGQGQRSNGIRIRVIGSQFTTHLVHGTSILLKDSFLVASAKSRINRRGLDYTPMNISFVRRIVFVFWCKIMNKRA